MVLLATQLIYEQNKKHPQNKKYDCLTCCIYNVRNLIVPDSYYISTYSYYICSLPFLLYSIWHFAKMLVIDIEGYYVNVVCK